MKKNVAGQKVGAQLISATDGSAFTGSVTVAVTVDAGTQATGSVGSGACTHEGGGYHAYAPSQGETNGDLVAFTFSGTGAIPVTVQIYTGFPQTGDSYPLVDTEVAAIKAKTDLIPPDPATETTLATLATAAALATVDGNVDAILVDTGTDLPATLVTIAGYIDTEVAAIKAKTDNLPAAPAATGDIPSAAAIATAVLTTAMTESYAANGSAPTLAQAVFLIQQMLAEKSVSGVTLTVKKLDGSTTAATFTLNDSSAPTSITRAT